MAEIVFNVDISHIIVTIILEKGTERHIVCLGEKLTQCICERRAGKRMDEKKITILYEHIHTGRWIICCLFAQDKCDALGKIIRTCSKSENYLLADYKVIETLEELQP